MEFIGNFFSSINSPLMMPVWYSIICGGIIGIDRELKKKHAGMRTSIFICVGAALFSYISQNIPGVLDSSRVTAQIVSGIGFIGGGVIIFNQDRLRGLTSAAIIWLIAALGVLNGMGMYYEAIMTSITVVVIDVFLGKVKWKLRDYIDSDEEEE
jgi:putative Mg2+ transporter-C (MgtC) family protein